MRRLVCPAAIALAVLTTAAPAAASDRIDVGLLIGSTRATGERTSCNSSAGPVRL